jgi:hypothetical protein
MTTNNEHLADTKRDAVALLRAVMHADQEGIEVITDNTRCTACLAVNVAVMATIMLVEDDDCIGLDEHDCIKVTGPELDRLDAELAGMCGAVNEPGETL